MHRKTKSGRKERENGKQRGKTPQINAIKRTKRASELSKTKTCKDEKLVWKLDWQGINKKNNLTQRSSSDQLSLAGWGLGFSRSVCAAPPVLVK
jgi:hypothetical protein